MNRIYEKLLTDHFDSMHATFSGCFLITYATFLVVCGLVIATFSEFWYNLDSLGVCYA